MNLNKSLKQLILYLIVGAIAAIVEWICFYLFFEILDINYLLAVHPPVSYSGRNAPEPPVCTRLP